MHKKSGLTLITVMIILFLIFALVGAFLFLATNARLVNERYHENAIALYLAEAGVDYAIWEINFGGADFTDWSGNPAAEATKSINNFQDDNGHIYGDINISVYNFGQDTITVRSTGAFNSITGPQLSRTVQVFLTKHHIGNYAILAQQNITISGNPTVDSYLGATFGRDQGNIVTNSQAIPAIDVNGNACTITGYGATGPGGTISDPKNKISPEYANAEIFFPPVNNPFSGLSSNGPLNGSTMITGNGKYDSISLSGSDKITMDCLYGAVNAYITGDIDLQSKSNIEVINSSPALGRIANIYFDGNMSMNSNNAKVNTGTMDPSSMIFYGKNTGSQSVILTGGDFYGVFYAPSADFAIHGNVKIYGSITGRSVTNASGTPDIHYDENLLINSPTIGYDPYVWQEK